jgi:3-hydroxybutyrate dehydrogenase
MGGFMDISSMSVLITGAAEGIGYALAEGFIKDGARVLAVDRNKGALEKLEEQGALSRIVDVSDPKQVEDMVDYCVKETGRLDVLINNAGIATGAHVKDYEPNQFENVVRINLFGPFYGMKYAIPVMEEQGFGRIINLVSRNAEIGMSGASAYGSSKAGLFALTRCAAAEVHDSNILVNGLIPGPTKTGMNPFGTQTPDVVYPTVRMMALFPDKGPSGKVFWDEKEYHLFSPENPTFNFMKRNLETRQVEVINIPEFAPDKA